MGAVIDTNILVFDTFEDSELHAEATTMLDSIDRWHLPSLIFHELIWFFRTRKIRLSQARQTIEEYLTNEKTSFSPCTGDDILFAVTRMRHYEDYNDLVILSVARRLGVGLLTFDEELRRTAIRNSIPLAK